MWYTTASMNRRHHPAAGFVSCAPSRRTDAKLCCFSADLGLSENVLFTGFLSGADRHEMYTAADLFVMPSVSEPFGIAPLESMKLGTPVIISRQYGVSEVVRHALKVDFWDVEEMAGKILSVVGYPALHRSLSENARNEADRLTWADAAIKVGGIVGELVH